MNISGKRSNGILMHITSLPSEYGIGDFGPEAYRFADKLQEAGCNYWQLLPLGPTGYGNSPYAARSTFAGNEMLISPEFLYRDGYIEKSDLEHPEFTEDKVDFQLVEAWKLPLLKKAAENFLSKNSKKKAYREFLERESYWLEDYALFMILYEKYYDARWHSVWDKKEGFRDEKTMKALKKEKKHEIEIWYALQYLFDLQLSELRAYVNTLGIKTIGDIPIFVGADSADAWSH
ncbi:MAG: 4-alpha-glucanotransferase, partial [Spirochaetales bacterium]|nr:4-alpha-glucanotransferase [Spirochaetales bacterium]